MSNKKNIWYISKYTAPTSSAKVGSRGFQILRELSHKGYNTALFTSDSNHLIHAPKLKSSIFFRNEDGVDVYWIKTIKYKSAKSLRRIFSWFDFEWKLWRMPKESIFEPDVIIVSSLSLLTIINGILLRKKYKCTLVFEVRDIWPLVLIESGGVNKYHPFVIFLSLIEKIAYKNADILVGTMPNLALHVENVLGFKRDVFCIPQGVDVSILENSNELSIDFFNTYIPKNKFIICYAGSIGFDNSLDTFFDSIRAMSYMNDIHFLILGEGQLKDFFEQKCKGLLNVSFAPRVEKNQVQSVLKKCDVLYLSVSKSSLWNFGQSLNKIIDYMVSGKPILASYSGYPSMINEADCGVIIPAEDAESLCEEIIRMKEMPKDELESMGIRGRDWILANRMYDRLADDYIKILDLNSVHG